MEEQSEYHRLLDARQAAVRAIDQTFNEQVKQLRDNCPHESLTQWLSAYCGSARLCRRCMKAVEKTEDYCSIGS